MIHPWKTALLKNLGPITSITLNNIQTNSNNNSELAEPIEDSIKIKKISKEVAQSILEARIAKKLTRKQLANQLNLKEYMIEDIETMKAVYNGDLIAKIKNHLQLN